MESVQVSRAISLVQPRKPTARHILYMSAVDEVLSLVEPNRTILFYKTNTEAAEAADILRRGLASALVAFYPLAGQLALDDDGRLAIDCNDSGVELIEASCVDVPFADLWLHGVPCSQPLFRRLAPMDHHLTSDRVGEPIVSLQVTSFAGGLTLGIAALHAVVDGYSFWMFVRALAEACKGEPLSIFPLHARSLLKPEILSLNKFPEPPAAPQLTPEDPTHAISYKDASCTRQAQLSDNKRRILSFPPEDLQQRSIRFTEDMLQTLKTACLTTHGVSFSTFEALSAYLWKRLTMAQELPDETRLRSHVFLDVRTRIIPPLTLAFFGNAVVTVSVITTAKELKAECLGATAARIRRQVQSADDAYIKKALVEREITAASAARIRRQAQNGDDKATVENMFNEAVKVAFKIRNARHFPVYEASAFGWGEPEVVSQPWGMLETMITWYPSKEPGSIDVLVSLRPSTSALFFSPGLYLDDPLLPHHQALLEPFSIS